MSILQRIKCRLGFHVFTRDKGRETIYCEVCKHIERRPQPVDRSEPMPGDRELHDGQGDRKYHIG